jgi:hypothetical protein
MVKNKALNSSLLKTNRSVDYDKLWITSLLHSRTIGAEI